MMSGARLFLFVQILAPALAFAAAAGGDHGHGVPWKMIGVQAFNFFFLFGLLVYLLRKTFIAHFQERRSTYQALVSKAEVAKQEAEKTHREVADRLNTLRASARNNASRAESEALELKNKLLQEAKEISAKLKSDAQKTTEVEIQKAKTELRAFALSEALKLAEDKLSKQNDAVDHKRLQSEFIDKIQAVTQ